MYLKCVAILTALLHTLGANMAASEVGASARSWLLPNSSYPLHYTLQLTTQIHRQNYTYTGNCTIELEVREQSEELVLHAANLSISDITIRQRESDALLDCVVYELEATHQLLVIKRAADCAQSWLFERYQHLSVTILYSALIGDNKSGFNKFRHDVVPSANVDDAQTVFGAATMFEPVSARTAFPCYDEPTYKANFTLSVSHDASYNVYSNMPIERQAQHAESADMLTTFFATTPPIASYAVAIIITQPYHIISKSSHGVVHRVLLPPTVNDDKPFDGLMDLQNSIDAVALMSDYFGQPYVLPKLDHFAWPALFVAGMENWGLITYKSIYLRLGSNMSDTENYSCLITQNHEIVHQWFGNLVTPHTWDEIWLSEGFATYYSYVFIDMLHPKLNATQRFDAICFDSYSKSTDFAIVNKMEKPSDLIKHFREVMYDRAPCVIQMFAHAFGAQVMQKALKNYLAANKYGNADSNNFIEALHSAIQADDAAANQMWRYDIETIMNSWLKQPNYPIVTVHRDYRTNQLHITQQSVDADSKQRWWLPLTFETSSTHRQAANHQKADVFMPATAEFVHELRETHDFKTEDWYLINADGKSFYLVNYDSENWRRIIGAMQREPRDFSLNTRISLMRNLWQACYLQTLEDPLILVQMLKYLRKEPDVLVLAQIQEIIFDAHLFIFEMSEFDALYTKFMHDLLKPHMSAGSPILLKFFYSDLELPKQLSDSEFEQKLANCMQSNDTEECFDCWTLLAVTQNDEHFERMLHEVYRIAQSNQVQCESKLEYMAWSVVTVHAIDRNLTWSKLATSFEAALEQAPCDIAVWAKKLLSNAERIEARYLEKVLHAVDLYDRKAVQRSGNTLRVELLQKRAKSYKTRVAGLRHWFYEHVNHTELYNFFHNALP